MIDQALQAMLRKHPFVEAFEPAHVDRLAALARPVSFERDQVVFHEGDECNDFFMITKGMVALEVEEPGQADQLGIEHAHRRGLAVDERFEAS